MNTTKTLIIHGWSDCAASFRNLKHFLIEQGFEADSIYYADYESREDSLTFNDVIDGLNKELIKAGIIDENGKKLKELNVIVHSTGGLVIRHWLWYFYYRNGRRIEDCPVKKIIMLAPANFGSPLAHRGKSFLGALFKGRWKIGDFLEVGRKLLDGLELASPFQWKLAHRDLLISDPYFTSKDIQVVILVGSSDYEGIRGWINKPGTDGTVVISGTPLNSAKILLDFVPQLGKDAFKWQVTKPLDDFAFAVLDGLNHGSIVEKASVKGELVSTIIVEALRLQNTNDFAQFKAKLESITESSYAKTQKPKFQQFVVQAIDDYGQAIDDYTLEFFILKKSGRNASCQTLGGEFDDSNLDEKEIYWSQAVTDLITSQFHKHTASPSFRRFLIDLQAATQLIEQATLDIGQTIFLSMQISLPAVEKGIKYDLETHQNIILYDPDCPAGSSGLTFFYPNTTTFIELKVKRSSDYVTIGLNPKVHDVFTP